MAYVGLSNFYYVSTDYMPVSPVEANAQAKFYAEKALSLSPDLPEAHTALAGALIDSYHWEEGEKEYKRAIELNPNYALAHMWYGLYLSYIGRHDEAIVHMKRALELDPLNIKFNHNLALVYSDARQYDLAVELYKRALDMDPSFASGWGNLGNVYFDMGKYDLWLEVWKKAATLNEDQDDLAQQEATARGFTASGIKGALRNSISVQLERSKRKFVDPSQIAYNYAALGDPDKALEFLDKAVAVKAAGLQPIKVTKSMDPYRKDPRYIDLLKRMNLPQ
jgi:tetratricopeptide (TPR) repeat protein